ncbi:MAG: response regulator [Planctomycetota bacterium]|jgi:CheY-like chemotaxis protein
MSKRILVIDDDEATRKLFVAALKDTEFTVDTAESGEEGLRMKQEGDYDLIFLDYKMPGINGVETLRRIRRTDRETPIYIFTAFHEDFLSELSIAQAESLKFEVLKKPLGAELIVKLAELILTQQKTEMPSNV